MGCGCHKKKEINNAVESAVVLRLNNNTTQLESIYNDILKKNIDTIITLFNSMLPVTIIASETDINCLECCEKHLAIASAYYMESKTKQYRINRFFAIGQMALAEMHVDDIEQLQHMIRNARLELQRSNKEPDWVILLELLEKYQKLEKQNE